MADKLRIGVIGAGRIGAVHARTIRQHEDAELIVVADPVGDAAASLAQSLGARSTTDADEALTADDVDAVIIASPTPLHIPHTVTAVKAGKSVLMEKPVALELDAVDACIAELGADAAKVMVGFNRRFDPGFSSLRKVALAGDIGVVEQVTIISRDPAPPPGEYLAVSGGIFKDMTIHDLDMARFMVGEIAAVHAIGQHLDPAVQDTYDAAVLTLTAASGAVVTIINSRHCAAGYDQRIEVFGSDGILEMENQRVTSVRMHDGHGTNRAAKFLPFFLQRYREAYALELGAFIAATRDGAPLSPSIADGREALVLAEAAAQSASTGATVALAKEDR